MLTKHTGRQILNLRAGDLVEVRSREEILYTLDDQGKLDSLPFMPEMLKYCGKRFKVIKRADKTCDTINQTGARRMLHAVHLEDVRCDGETHGGCQAGCLIFWKEDWLKRPESSTICAGPSSTKDVARPCPTDLEAPAARCSEYTITKATRVQTTTPEEGEIFSCQTTELFKATSPLQWWDARQYIRDLRSRNVRVDELIQTFMFWVFAKLLRIGGYRALVRAYDLIQKSRGRWPYPYKQGKLMGKAPAITLNLRPGELVQVKQHDEILETVNLQNKNRGLSFDPEMVPYCGRTFKVLRRVEKLIHERTGKMMYLPNDCVVLDGVTCQAWYSQKRFFCPRSIYPYWREIWLKRAG